MPPVVIVGDQNQLVSTKQYPNYASFPFENFNPVQSRIFEIFDKPGTNIIVSAATSSGKTITAEMIMAYTVRVERKKAIYLAPMKALAKEKIDDWLADNHHFKDLKLAICTGDYRLTPDRKKELEEADIIMLTTEMLNSRCRHFNSEHNEFLREVGCLVSDEFHLIGVPGRGDHAEVGLMKFCEINPDCRIVALSATMPNVVELAEWISYTLTGRDTYLLKSEYRPCPLGVHWELYEDVGPYDIQEENKVSKAMDIIREYPDDIFLVFAHTKKTGEMMKRSLKSAGIKCEFHSADLDKDDRHKIEEQFRTRKLRVLIATSTVAWGCYASGTPVAMADGTTKPVESVRVGDLVLSMDKTKFLPQEVLEIGSKTVRRAIKVSLTTGEAVTVSKDHLFYAAANRDVPDWLSAKSLRVGDYLAVPTRYSEPKLFQLDKSAYLLGVVLGDGCLTDAGTFASGQQKVVLDISGDSADFPHLNFVRNMLSEVASYSVPEIRSDSNDVSHIVCKAKVVTDLFNGLVPVGRKSNKIFIPDEFFKDKFKLASVLTGLFDTDGGVCSHSNGNYSVEYNSVCEKIVRQIQHALLVLGVRSSVGKKKVKDSVINGRLQKARRKWSWRVRIYKNELSNFQKSVGFLHNRKQMELSVAISANKEKSSEIIPVRSLIDAHAKANGINVGKMCKSIGCDSWTLKNRQDISRSKLELLLQKYPQRSILTDLYNLPILWKKIVKLETVKGGTFHDLEIANTHNFVGGSVVSHNCNLPARRVILLGVHRGLNEVEDYDVKQMIGRSGRVGLDPRGDAYILLPEKKAEYHRSRLLAARNIESRLLDFIGEDQNKRYKTLAFHLVSEIHHGAVQTKEDAHRWFKKSFAHFQSNSLHDEILDSTLTLLIKCGAIKEEEGIYKVTAVGRVSSMFYYSPFDVADLRKNFKFLFENNFEGNDIALAMSLGAVDTMRMGFVSKAEMEEMGTFAAKVARMYGNIFTSQDVKGGYAYFTLLNGLNPGVFAAMSRNLQFDFPRLMQVLNALDSMSCYWDKRRFFSEVELRVSYGVGTEMVHLCRLPNVGKVRAERLWAAGLRTYEAIVADPSHVQTVLNMNKDRVAEICTEAKKLI